MTHGLLRALIVAAALGIAGLGDAAQGVAGERPGALADLRVAKGERDIAEVWLAGPTTRYRHYVLGSRYEASRVEVRLADGRRLAYVLPEDSVFEDRQPRLADLDGDGRDEIVLVRADIERGASLAVLGVDRGRLVVIAQGPPTGRAHTWLNPAGIADFDGDGSVDIAYVQMPHILGRLRIFTLRERKLVQIATLPDTSNHVAGSPQMGLSAVADFDGDGIADLAVPSLDRRTLRFLSFKGGKVRELKRQVLPAPAVADFTLERRSEAIAVGVGLGNGRRMRVVY